MNLEIDYQIISYGGNYKSYWINDNCNNIIPKNWGEFPEGFNVIDFLREITEELDFKSVLDFGCGYGRLSKAFDSDKYLGIDLNYKALKIARDDNAGINTKRHLQIPNITLIAI